MSPLLVTAYHKNKDETEGVLPVKTSLIDTAVSLALQCAGYVTRDGQSEMAASCIFTKHRGMLQF